MTMLITFVCSWLSWRPLYTDIIVSKEIFDRKIFKYNCKYTEVCCIFWRESGPGPDSAVSPWVAPTTPRPRGNTSHRQRFIGQVCTSESAAQITASVSFYKEEGNSYELSIKCVCITGKLNPVSPRSLTYPYIFSRHLSILLQLLSLIHTVWCWRRWISILIGSRINKTFLFPNISYLNLSGRYAI